ncbi:MAG: FAD-dependent oxidoreductase [Armatimonadetes bacterium]|nr:FAD-dependent oxidoreductase [Armatimonadota bacterium]
MDNPDILIVGGGTGGCAAALAAAGLGLRVVLTEETDWLGGQLTSQAVPPDEHPWIEQYGSTLRYRQWREGVRRYYREHYPLLPHARMDPYFSPGHPGRQFSAEFTVALAVLEQMLAPHRSVGRLDVRLRRKPVAAHTEGDRVTALTLLDRETGREETLTARIVLDATELGELLPLAGVEYVSGTESQDETGELHAPAGPPRPDNVQPFTWCLAMGYDPHGKHVLDPPEQYDRWLSYAPQMTPPWPGKLLSWWYSHPVTLEPFELAFFPGDPPRPGVHLWPYRRVICRDHYPAGVMPEEASIPNWPQNDYLAGSIIDQPEEVVARHLRDARQLSLSLFHWLQTEAPRPDGGEGYPGLYLRGDLVGTSDGLAKCPYIRESRRIRAVFTVTEEHVGAEQHGRPEAEPFDDSVGLGYYRIDLHPSTGGDNYIDFASLPFRIPLGALLPVRVENLLPACKSIGTTHLTNGCYRLHPVEWNIGESAGLLAAFALQSGVPPRAVREQEPLLREFQGVLRDQGVELAWP